jgi:hypothetical protein
MKGIICCIYESKRIGNCSNNGISKFHKEVTLVPSEDFPDIPEIFSVSDTAPAVKLRIKNGYISAVPVNDAGKWFMMGGCFIYRSDSRFPVKHPVALHDRTE